MKLTTVKNIPRRVLSAVMFTLLVIYVNLLCPTAILINILNIFGYVLNVLSELSYSAAYAIEYYHQSRLYQFWLKYTGINYLIKIYLAFKYVKQTKTTKPNNFKP